MNSPLAFRKALPLSDRAALGLVEGRRALSLALAGEIPCLAVLVGPCSLHDAELAREYGKRLARLAARLRARPSDWLAPLPAQEARGPGLLLVMRAYPEKSRTALGFRGLAEEPGLDGRRDPLEGIRLTRELLVDLASLGLPLAAEIVSPFMYRYWEDCLSWAAVGARGVEAQYLRELAATLPFPCGFKNDRSGDPKTSIDACLVASKPITLLGLGLDGTVSPLEGKGNPLPNVVLRGKGGGKLPAARNYRKAASCAAEMEALGLKPAIILDAAHGNLAASPWMTVSKRAESSARLAFRLATEALGKRKSAIRGVMIESSLAPGCQKPGPRASLVPGVSITDPCLGWEETEELIVEAAERLSGLFRG